MRKVLTFLSKMSILSESVEKTVKIGVLAQLGEHLPYKQRVTGSSPVGPIFYAHGRGEEISSKCCSRPARE